MFTFVYIVPLFVVMKVVNLHNVYKFTIVITDVNCIIVKLFCNLLYLYIVITNNQCFKILYLKY